VAELEQENARLRQMYLKLSLEHSALQEMVIEVAMRHRSAARRQNAAAGSATPAPGPNSK
jgi:hypothetical protein